MAGVRGQGLGGGRGLEWVEAPENPGVGRESRSGSPTSPATGACPAPTSHTHLGP